MTPTLPPPRLFHPRKLMLLALLPLALLFVDEGPTSQYALWGLLVTTAAGLVSQYLKDKREERRHKWEAEEREKVAQKLEENTELTKATLEAAKKPTTKE